MKEKNFYQQKSNSKGFIRAESLVALISILALFVVFPVMCQADEQTWAPAEVVPGPEQHPPELLKLAEEITALRGGYSRRWHPGWGNGGVPDYAAFAQRQKEQLPKLRARLDEVDPTDWSQHYKIDYLLLRAEMDQLEWELYVVRQWSRNPSFYVDQAIRNVGRLIPAGRHLGQNPTLMPYSKERAQTILRALANTEKILAQGRKNLTEIVPILVEVALRDPGGSKITEGGELKYTVDNYKKWAEITATHFPPKEAKKLVPAAIEAGKRFLEFGKWLKQNRDRMTGKYYIGKDPLNWYLRHVFLLPYDSDQLKFMAEMERDRAISYVQFELQRNRHLPEIKPAKTTEEYLAWENETHMKLRRWYLENGEDLLSDQDYQPLMRAEKGLFIMPFGIMAFPTEEKPGNIHRLLRGPADHWSAKYPMFGGRTDPGAGGGHDDWPGHRRQGKIHQHNPCPIRRHHVDSIHSEGSATYLEELVVALDFPFVRGPRARELTYNRLLQRAERILVGVPLLCGDITPEEALRTFLEHNPPLGSHLGATPEAAFEEMYKHVIWRANDCFDATTGKFQLLKLLADRKMQLKDKFDLKEFHDQYMKFGQIPFSLLKWEMLGDDSEAKMFWEPVRLSRVLKK